MFRLLVFIIGVWILAAPGPAAEAKPFRRVLVLSGGQMRVAAGLGMLAEAVSGPNPWVPDLVIYTCGFSLGGALVNATSQKNDGHADPKDWLAFILSRTFWKMMTQVRVNTDFFHKRGPDGKTESQRLYREIITRVASSQASGLLETAGNLMRWVPQSGKAAPVAVRPRIFRSKRDSLVDVPQNLAPPGLDLGFSSQGIRVLFVASRILFSPAEQGKPRQLRPKENLYQETDFTDPLTAQEIRRVGYGKSPIAELFPDAPIHPDVDVVTGAQLFAAAGAALREPYLTPIGWINNPQTEKNEAYLAGAMNGSPIELALALGDEVMAIKTRPMKSKGLMPPIEGLVFEDIFGFPFERRRSYVEKTFGDELRWILVDDTEKLEEEAGFSPKQKGEGQDMYMVDTIPMDNPQKFAEMAQKQWDWGVEKMRAALADRPE